MSAGLPLPFENDGVSSKVRRSTFSGTTATSRCWTVYNSDASLSLRNLPRSTYDCVVTSPPYFWLRDYGVDGQLGKEPTIDEYVGNICKVMDDVRDVLQPRGLLFLVLGDTYYSAKGQPQGHDRKHGGRRFRVLRAVDTLGLGVPKKTAIGIPWRVALEMISRGWILRCPIIWHKPGIIPESNARDRPWRTYETIFMFSKSRSYHFSREALRSHLQEDIWSIPARSKAGREHGAVFPSELARRCLQVGCSEGGEVLDPFAGSGTTLKVALEMGMNATGIEINPAYCSTMANELSQL